MERPIPTLQIRFYPIFLLTLVLVSCDKKDQAVPFDSPASKLEYREIYAPVFVGRPPSDAYIGLSRLENGEVRHYDYGEQSQLVVEEIREEMRPARKYIYSRAQT